MDVQLLDGLSQPQAWDSRLETGVATIDLQHRILFEMMLRIRDGAAQGPGIDLRDLLMQLRAYADYHFRYEEDWIHVNARDPLIPQGHEHLHAAFGQRLGQLEEQLACGRLDAATLYEFLRRWLIDHIIRQDLPVIGGLRQPAGPAPAAP